MIALRFGGDLTGPEIAELIGLTLANVQQILSRSLRRLRSQPRGGLSAAAASFERFTVPRTRTLRIAGNQLGDTSRELR